MGMGLEVQRPMGGVTTPPSFFGQYAQTIVRQHSTPEQRQQWLQQLLRQEQEDELNAEFVPPPMLFPAVPAGVEGGERA